MQAAWLHAHPEVHRAKDQGYRARKPAPVGSFSAAEWLALVERYGGAKCDRRKADRAQEEFRALVAREAKRDR
jgi:hypothetical protein